MTDIDPKIEIATKVHKLTQQLFCALTIDAGWTEENQEVVFDVSIAVESLLYLVALLIESDPELSTSRDIRLTCDRAAERLKQMVRTARGHTERTGQHPLEMFGGLDTFTLPDQNPH